MINRVILQGRLTDHPELKHTQNGKDETDFYIAVESGKKKSEERTVEIFRIKAWASAAEFICKYFEKGQQIIIDGKLHSESYTDRNQNKRKDVTVLVDSVSFCGAKSPEAQGKSFDEAFNDDIEAIY